MKEYHHLHGMSRLVVLKRKCIIVDDQYVQTIAMIFARPNHIPLHILKRLELLIILLSEYRRDFEALAHQIQDRGLRDSVLELAQECKQYSHELLGQFETMSGCFRDFDDALHPEDKTLLHAAKDILHSCQLSEQNIIIAFRTLLNEPLLDENFRKLLRNQSQGIACAFMKIKLFNSLLR